MKYLIILIFLISIFSIKLSENFTCNRNLYYTNKIFRPLRMIILDNSDTKNKDNADNIISKNLINKSLSKIKLSYSSKNIFELPHSKYDYKKGFIGSMYNKSTIDSVNNRLSKIILNKISKQIEKDYSNLCNNNCNIEFIKYRIKRLGKLNNNLVLEGQLFYDMIHGSKQFMVEYVVINNINLDILYLKLGGIEYKKVIDNELAESDTSHNKLNILGSPLYGKYELPKTHLYSSLEENLKPKNKFKNIDRFSYFCYGKKALNKIECEKIDDTNIRGIWDKSCNDDRECPFYYQDSKNGGCNNGQCEFPIGVERVSPRKYINIKNALCSGCNNNGIIGNGNCCIKQMNRKLYPNLLRPSYIFNHNNR